MKKEYMNNVNLKNTKNREKILYTFESTAEPLCAEDIYNILDKKINIATIYRNLNALSNKKILNKIIFDDGKMYYKLNDNTHTHNLVCNICHNITPIKNCPIDLISKKVKETTGYEITNHLLELKGICPKCQNLLKAKSFK